MLRQSVETGTFSSEYFVCVNTNDKLVFPSKKFGIVTDAHSKKVSPIRWNRYQACAARDSHIV